MRIGPFEVDESVRELRNPHVISTLRPWIDAGSVGKLVLTRLQERLGAQDVGSLARPGQFFDFTRYRPIVRGSADDRSITVPNTTLSAVRRTEEPDLLFLDMLEPHSNAEDYVDSVLELLSTVGTKAFWRIGAWWGAVPHTRPLRVSHAVGGKRGDPKSGRPISQGAGYEGPTSIMSVVNDDLEKLRISNNSLMLQLPHYAQLEEDYSAAAAVLETVSDIYGLASELEESIIGFRARGEPQYAQLSDMVAGDPDMRALVQQLEAAYDAEVASAEDDTPPLSPEIEGFLGEVTGKMDSGEGGDG